MNSKVKIFAALAVAMMVISAVPISICNYSEGSSDGLPSSYDLRDTYNNVTDVRNQGNEGLCWAFALSAALEGEMINMGYDKSSTKCRLSTRP